MTAAPYPGPRATILVVEDEPQLRLLLRRTLEREGHAVIDAVSAADAVASLKAPPDVVLLDLGLPDRDGLELVPIIREAGMALIVITARDAITDKVAALDLGADDYVTKPFDTLEIAARIRTALRHRASPGIFNPMIVCGRVVIDLARRLVASDGEAVHLAPKEFAVLAELARNAGKVLTHAHLLRTVWGPAHADDIEYLRVTVRGIRRKLGETPEHSIIRNEPAVGYRLVV